jgi:hypothetical protein
MHALQARKAPLGHGTLCHSTDWEPPLPPPRPHDEVRLSRFFSPNCLRSSLPLRLPVLQAPTTAFVGHRSSLPTPECRCPALPPPPLRRTTASVCPRQYHLARCFPPITLELPPPVPPHHVGPLDADGCATTGVPCAVTTWCACRATSTGWLGSLSALGRCVGQAATPQHCGLGSFPAQHCAEFKNCFPFILNSQIVSKFQKSIGSHRNVKKWQTKFCMNPLEQLYIVGTTKFIIVQ